MNVLCYDLCPWTSIGGYSESFPLHSQFPAILASLIYSTIVRIRGGKRSLCDRHPYFLHLLVTAV